MKYSDISEHIDDLTGIKLYRDGFWVRPYGDIGNDWLGGCKSTVKLEGRKFPDYRIY